MPEADLDMQLPAAPYPWQEKLWSSMAERLAEDKLAHAFLLSGAAGIGKFEFLRQFARLILCLQPDANKVCGHCHNCQLGSHAEHPDIMIVAPEEGARDISISQIRDLGDFVNHTSHSGLAKVVIIDQAHRMNIASGNALLKTLEEPSQKTFLFLSTDLPGYLLATIRSRCQRISMAVPSLEITARWLEQYLGPEDDATALLAATGCRPMQAIELAASGSLQERHQFVANLLQSYASPEAADKLVNQALKIGPLTAIEYLSHCSSTLIKELASDGSNSQADELTQGAARRLRDFDGARVLKLLSGIYQESLQARKQLLSSANPMPQLILESVFWHWVQLDSRLQGH
jgi:DNA polymerase-3 subunit delta'